MKRMFPILALVFISFAVVISLLPPQPSSAEGGNRRNVARQAGQPKVIAAQNVGLQPQSSVAVGFAVSKSLSEIAAEQTKPLPLKYQRPVSRKEYRDEQQNKNAPPNIPLTPAQEVERETEREKNLTNRAPIRQINESAPASPDAAIYTGPGGNRATTPLIPGTTVNFEGQSIFDTITLGQGFLPPDTVGDVGPNHYVQMVNSTFRIWDKTGTPLIPTTSIGALFGSIPGPCAGSEDGDPIVLYDSLADRWMLSEFCTVANPNNHQLIAISQTPDPTGAYFLYDFMMPNNKFNDYPKFGVWPDGYYMTDNQFNQAGTAFLGAGAFAFDRAKMLAGDPAASFIYFDLETLDPSIGGVLPSDADGLTPPPAGAPNVFSYFIATEFADASDGLRLFNFHADFATPANSTFIERAGSPLAVAAFDPLTPAGRDDIEQPLPAVNATQALDAIGDRLMHRLQYRNFGTHESLVVSHTVNVGTGTTQALHQAGVRYYELRKTGMGAYAVNEQASYAPDTVNRWMPSAAMDHQGNLAIGYSVSDAVSVFPGIRYAGRLAGDAPNGLPQGEATLQAGGFVQTNTSSRWGDYSSLNLDPSDDCTFWATNEYYLDDQPSITAEWHTRIGAFKVNPTCAAPQQGRLVVNVTNCDSLLAVQGATITVDNNLYGSTIANGSYGTQLSPGTYNLIIGGTNYFPAMVNGVVITNGMTTTVNQCITGSPNIDDAGATYTAESCMPADMALSGGETVTLDFGLKNNGTASTTSLVATLQATGGVTSPSGPQNYGSIPPDNTTVITRPFTFTADAGLACGDLVTATFQLQDGANNLGTVTFTLQVGAAGPSATATYGTGNIVTPIPDLSSVDIPISVPDNGLLDDINVRVRLNHTFDGDIVISLIHPDGTVLPLSNNRGGAGANYGTGTNNCSGTFTVFDDQAATAIGAGTAPFAGSFRPEQMLSTLNGKPSAGTWKVRFSDTAALDTGTVGCVQLEIRRFQFVCCGSATPTPTPTPTPVPSPTPPPVPTATPLAPYQREREPNNSSATATAINTPARVQGNIFPNGDIDFYSFTANAGDRIYAAVMTSWSANASTDSQLRLFASDGTTLIEFDEDDGSLGGFSSSIAGATIPLNGTYFLQVNHFSATNQLRPYELYVRVQSGSPTPEVEPNDVPGTANSLPMSGWVSGTRNPAMGTEQDWFSFTANAGDTVYLGLDLDPERDVTTWNGRLGIAIFGDANNQVLVVDDDGAFDTTDSEAFFFTVKTAGTYYAFVDSATAGTGGPTATYNLSVTVYPKIDEGVNCTTYTSTNVPKTIGPGALLVSSTITVPGNPRIADIDVSIQLNHTVMQEIDAHLRSPAGNDNGLFTDVGAAATGGQALMDLILDDEAAIPPAFTIMRPVSYKPELNYRLHWFDGENAGGVWTLDLRDDVANTNGGTLTGWSLRICEQPPPPSCIVPATTPQTIFTTDFETDDGGFTHSGSADEWERGLPATAATSGINPAAAFTTCNSGVNCWKTDLDSTYEPSSNQELVSPSIALTALTLSAPITLSWAQRYQLENATFDHYFVEVREVGMPSNSQRVFEYQDSTMTNAPGSPVVNIGASAGWGLFSADISRFYGKTIEIVFHVDSDSTVNFPGVAIDDIKVTACTYGPTAADSSVSGSITDQNGVPVAGAVVNLAGAQNRRFITDANGNYSFENVETGGFYTVTPSLANYHFTPGSRSFSQVGNNTNAAFTATRDSIMGVNLLDTPEYFVRQHYLDFLGREPDESGFNFWSDQILSCGNDAACIERRTINVSAAYFLSIEFQQTGGLVDGLYRASYGRAPRYAEFMPDTAAVARDVAVGRDNWVQNLEANKQAFVSAWMQRADFRAAYDALGNNSFVDTLIGHAGAGFNGDRQALVDGLNSGSLSRALALRKIVENEGFANAKRNEMFVMMQYFGYLRRDPDQSGYAFWLNKLNEFNGNFEQAEMVKAFIVSGEYRARFAR